MTATVAESLWPGNTLADAADIGGKAAGLAALVSAGIEVPAFVVLDARAFDHHLRRPSVRTALGGLALALESRTDDAAQEISESAAQVRAAITAAELAPGLAERIAAALPTIGAGPFAVRSSMLDEDSTAHSFAGQLDSHLYQDSAAVLDSVRRTWASAFGERVLSYSARIGRSVTGSRVAVVIQQMVDADVSGVLFTANPRSGTRDEYLVTAAYGLGEGIVSGLCDTDEYTWSGGAERSATLADKDIRVVRASGGGVAEQAVPAPLRERRALTPAQVDEICSAGTRIAALHGRPMDIEWSYAGGTLYILQARPITAAYDDPRAPALVFDNSNIQESYNGVTTPLTFSFSARVYSGVYKQLAGFLGVSERRRAEFGPAADNLLAFVHGRIFYQMNNWLSLFALLPGYERSTENYSKVMWHTDIDGSRLARRRRTPRAVIENLRVAAGIAARYVTLDREILRFLDYFQHIYDLVDRDSVPAMTVSEAHDTLRFLYSELMSHWDIPNINDFRVMMYSGHLRRVLVARYPEAEVDTRLADLLCAIDGIESMEPTRILLALADEARADDGLRAVLTAADPAAARTALGVEYPAFARRIDDYVRRYGDRCVGELKLESVPVRHRPWFVVEMIRNYLEQPGPAGNLAGDRARHDRALADLTARMPWWRRRFAGVEVRATRTAIKARESLRFRRTLAFALVRDLYATIGRRLAEQGVLADERDILFLTVDEIDQYLEARAASTDLAGTVRLRKAEFARNEAASVPDRFETHGTPYLQPIVASAATQSAGDDTDPDALVLRGLGCCGGVVDAPVRVLPASGDVSSVAGDILCTVRTDPGWTPLLTTARGLIVERGSVLSHSAIVARELGIPTVVGIKDVTRILLDREHVQVDGTRGTVTRFRRQQ
ncbi:PEP/pyruvate-binding domain-containing protein [Nocardia mexicana]|uniref:Pyruvate,water dikinase n=1 Tax=Nocardia mexicana TaxID=279262 RepID=A0A370HJA4_9NOCA|nr:PEP/pyruvate-binding domain-containing protein [Nocardia mexicana]RDI55569.1 pyruvate,water dikinase [Nocardia mexicana]